MVNFDKTCVLVFFLHVVLAIINLDRRRVLKYIQSSKQFTILKNKAGVCKYFLMQGLAKCGIDSAWLKRQTVDGSEIPNNHLGYIKP